MSITSTKKYLHLKILQQFDNRIAKMRYLISIRDSLHNDMKQNTFTSHASAQINDCLYTLQYSLLITNLNQSCGVNMCSNIIQQTSNKCCKRLIASLTVQLR